MKHLTLKAPNTEAKPTIAKQTLENARKAITNFMANEIQLIFLSIYGRNPNFEEDEEWTISTGDLADDVYINVEVDNSYLDVEDTTCERREISEISCALDGSIYLFDEDGNDWNVNEISLEELSAISDILEITYLNRVENR